VSVFVRFRRRESAEDVDAAFRLDLIAQPLRELVERDHEVAVITHRRRRDRKLDFAGLREEVDRVVMHGRGERRAFRLKIRDQLAQRRRIEHRAREHVRAWFAGLLEQRDRQRLAALFLLQLRQPQRCRHPRRSAADDQDVDVEGLALIRHSWTFYR